MDGSLGLLGGTPGDGGGRGGGGPSGGSTTAGSILTISNEDNNSNNNHNMSAEVSSSFPVDDDDDLELGLGLSIGGRGGGGLRTKEEASGWGQHVRILTTKDIPFSKPNFSSSASSSSVNIPNSSTGGTKRTAIDSVSPPNATSVVGWPPIRRAQRMPILANQTKSEHNEFSSRAESKNKTSGYLSVKVNMDGTLIGRKVDLNAHSSYEMLAQTLEDMFYGRRSSTEATASSRLLNGTSEFVLTYEDRDGDCMLVGDVPWLMFISSVKRLRLLRNPKSSGLAPSFQEKNRRRRTDAI